MIEHLSGVGRMGVPRGPGLGYEIQGGLVPATESNGHRDGRRAWVLGSCSHAVVASVRRMGAGIHGADPHCPCPFAHSSAASTRRSQDRLLARWIAGVTNVASMSADIAAGQRGSRPPYGSGREALLDAAITVVARRGLRYLTYRAVAAEAGVTHGLVAHHFGSRDALLLAALRHSVERAIDITELRTPSSDPEDFVQGLADMVERAPDLHAFQYEVLLEARRSPEVREHAAELYASYRSAAREGLAQLGIADGPLADLVFAALDGLVFQQITVGPVAVTEAAIDALRRLLAAVRDDSPVRASSRAR